MATRRTTKAGAGEWLWMRVCSAAQILGLVVWRVLSGAVRLAKLYRETTLWPFVLAGLIFVVGVTIFLTTGRKPIVDLGDIVAMLVNLCGILAVVMLVGAMRSNGFLLPEIEDEEKAPWQKLAVVAAATVALVLGLSWLVLSH